MAEDKSSIEYRDIQGFPGYRVGNDGSVWSCKNGKWGFTDTWKRLRPSSSKKSRHMLLHLRSGGKSVPVYVHVLVLTAFVGPCPDGMECRHLDGDAKNNRLENLKWGTRLENVHDAMAHGTFVCISTLRHTRKA